MSGQDIALTIIFVAAVTGILWFLLRRGGDDFDHWGMA